MSVYVLTYHVGIPGVGMFHSYPTTDIMPEIHRICIEHHTRRYATGAEYDRITDVAQTASEWCIEHFGDPDFQGPWFRRDLMMGPTFNFTNEKDAMIFKLAVR